MHGSQGTTAAPAKVIDMRSDTVTKPTDAMKRAMAEADVGDDVFGDDPTVIRLEREAAALFKKEAGLFVPTGTMSNLCAIMAHCDRRGSEILVGCDSHIHIYEQGGCATLASCHPRAVPTDDDGTLSVAAMEVMVRPVDDHFPTTRLVCLETTHNKKGGKALPKDYIESVGAFAKRHNLAFHIDGARIFNACAALGVAPDAYTATADSVSVCLSKGLGAPAGSVLLGSAEFVRLARRARKALGGGMRQSGVLAAAGLIALHDMPANLPRDHANAQRLFEAMAARPEIAVEARPDTNIVFASLRPPIDTAECVAAFVNGLKARGILMLGVGGARFRIVTHHQVSEADIDTVIDAIGATLDDISATTAPAAKRLRQ